MRSPPLGALLLPLVLLACQPSATTPPTPTQAGPRRAEVEPLRLTGTVRGHAGEPLRAAHLTVRRAHHRSPVIDLELPSDGHFDLTLPGPGAYTLMFAGVDHAAAHVAVIVDEREVDLELRLGTYPRPAWADSLPLQLRWVDDAGVVGEPWTLDAPRASTDAATLAVEVAPKARALQIQILGDRRYNSPGGDRWVYDGGGDYWAEIPVDGDLLERVLDFATLPPAELVERLTVTGATLYPQAAARAILAPHAEALWATDLDYGDDPERRRAVSQAVTTIAEQARANIEALDDPALARAAALEWLLLWGQFVRDDLIAPGDLTWVFERVPAADPFWQCFASNLTNSLFFGLGSSVIDAQRAALAAAQDEPGLQAALLYLDLLDAKRRDDPAAIAELYPRLAAGYPDTYSADYAATEFDPERPLMPGKPMPDWSFPALDRAAEGAPGVPDTGAMLSAAELRGRPYLLDIWASWCGPCVGEMPHLHAAYEAMRARASNTSSGSEVAIEFVGLSMDDSADAVASFREQWPMPWVHAIVPAGDQDPLYARWKLFGVPTVVLVDADGIIVEVGDALRGDELAPRLEAFLAR